MHKCILLKSVAVSAINNLLNSNVLKSGQLEESYILFVGVRYRFAPVLIFFCHTWKLSDKVIVHAAIVP